MNIIHFSFCVPWKKWVNHLFNTVSAYMCVCVKDCSNNCIIHRLRGITAGLCHLTKWISAEKNSQQTETKDIPLALSCEQLWVHTQDMQLVSLSSKGKFLETQCTERDLMVSFNMKHKKIYGKKPKMVTQLMSGYVEEWTRNRNQTIHNNKILMLNLFSLA